MGRAVLVDAILVVLVLSWIGGSMWYFSESNALFFQRLGAWGVAVSIFYFLFIREKQSVPDEVIRRFSAMNKHVLLNSQHVKQAYVNAGLAAFENHKTRKELGLEELPFGSQMADLLKVEAGKPPVDYEAVLGTFDELDTNEISANKEVRLGQRLRAAWQNSMAVVATLQWGFGDLLVNIFNGCGQWEC